MSEKSFLWTTGTSGDGATTVTTDDWFDVVEAVGACHGFEGIGPGYLNEFAGTIPAANTVRINTGVAIVDGRPYRNKTTQVDVTIPSAGAGETRIDRIVLEANWATYTVRITRIAGTSAVGPTAPAVNSTSKTLYDKKLYQVTVTDAGVCTLTTDEREYADVTPAKVPNRTRKFLVPCCGGLNATDTIASLRSSRAGEKLEDNHEVYAYGNFYLPSDYVSGLTITCIVVSNAAGNIYGRAYFGHGAAAESHVAHLDTVGWSAVAVIEAVNSIYSVTPTNVSAGDYYSLEFGRDAANALDTVNDDAFLMGFLVSYTADS